MTLREELLETRGELLQAKMELAEAQAKLQEVERDASRYRWLLSRQAENGELSWMSYTYIKNAHKDMNAAIDASMEQTK